MCTLLRGKKKGPSTFLLLRIYQTVEFANPKVFAILLTGLFSLSRLMSSFTCIGTCLDQILRISVNITLNRLHFFLPA